MKDRCSITLVLAVMLVFTLMLVSCRGSESSRTYTEGDMSIIINDSNQSMTIVIAGESEEQVVNYPGTFTMEYDVIIFTLDEDALRAELERLILEAWEEVGIEPEEMDELLQEVIDETMENMKPIIEELSEVKFTYNAENNTLEDENGRIFRR